MILDSWSLLLCKCSLCFFSANSWLISSRFPMPIQEALALFIEQVQQCQPSSGQSPDWLCLVKGQLPCRDSQTLLWIKAPRSSGKHRLLGPTQFPVCGSVDGAWVFAPMKGPQVMLRLLFQGPHFSTSIKKQWLSLSQEIIWAMSHCSGYKRSSFFRSRSQDYIASSKSYLNKAD